MTISVRNLSFSYDRRNLILDKINFEVAQGQFVGIFGPNGGGKTSLLKLMLGLLKANTGELELIGMTPTQASNKIGYVPQVRRYDKQFPISVLEVVLQGCLADYRGFGSFSAEAKKRAFDALEKVGLCDKANAPFGTLSGGQIQRMLIARALASQPKILLLDEATVGVDPEALSEIFKFLIGLKGEITILMVTHDLQTIAKEMDMLLCINRQLTFYTPKQVCEHFAMGLYHPKLMKEQQDND